MRTSLHAATPSAPGTRAALALVVLGALVALCAVQSLGRPLGGDQGVFAWIGGIIVQGGSPYRDAWDTKGPMVFLAAAAVEAVTGRHAWGLRALDLVVTLGGAFGLRQLAIRLGGGWVARWGAPLLYLLWWAGLDFWNSAQPDGWVGALVVWAMLASVRGHADGRPATGAAVAGLLLGLCAMVKPPYAALLALPLLHPLVARWQYGRSRTGVRAPRAAVTSLAGPMLAGVLAAAIPIAACAAWLSSRGALAEAIDVHLRWNATVYAGLSGPWLRNRLPETLYFLLQTPLAIALAPALAGLAESWGRHRAAGALLGGWSALVLAVVLVQGKFWVYQWLPLYAPVALLAALGADGALSTPGDRSGAGVGARRLAVATTSVVLFAAAFPVSLGVYRWAKSLRGGAARDAYEAREYGDFGRQRGSMLRLGQALAARTAPDDRILFWGLYPGINWIVRRDPPTRLAVNRPVFDGPGTEYRARYRAELLRALESTPPAFVVAPTPENCGIDRAGRDFCLERWPELATWLAARYDAETVPGGHVVMRRRERVR